MLGQATPYHVFKLQAWEGDKNSVINTMINPYSSLVHTCVVYILTPVTAMPIYHRIPLIPTISILCTKIDFETAPVTSCTGQQNFPPSCKFPSFQNLARALAAKQDLPVSDPLLVFSDKCLGQELMPAFAVLPQKSRLCPLSCRCIGQLE